MDEMMIRYWNETVMPDDTVYHLGDFAFINVGFAQRVFDRLHGEKHLIAGNHDIKIGRYVKGWASISDIKELRLDGERIVLCHYPLHSWNGASHGTLHFHGHCHGSVPSNQRRLDMGVDCWNYRPVTMANIHAKRNTLPESLPTRGH